jgi:transcriptional regulator with XRE-family HTH domain
VEENPVQKSPASPEPGWAPERVVAWAVRRHRDNRLHISAQELADRVTEAGGKLSRQAISKIENGDRGISVAELLVLARALEVPPLLLLYPDAERWHAAKWFTGEAPLPGAEDSDWNVGAAPAQLRRMHDRAIEDWYNAPRFAQRLGVQNDRVDPGQTAWLTDRLRVWAFGELWHARRGMLQMGLDLPELPEALAAADGPPGGAVRISSTGHAIYEHDGQVGDQS